MLAGRVLSGGGAGDEEQREVREHASQEAIPLGDAHPGYLLLVVGIREEAYAAAAQALVGPGTDRLSIQERNEPVVLHAHADLIVTAAFQGHRQRQLHAIVLTAAHHYVANQ